MIELSQAAVAARMPASAWQVLLRPLQHGTDEEKLLLLATADLAMTTTTMELQCWLSVAEVWFADTVSPQARESLRDIIRIGDQRYLFVDGAVIDLANFPSQCVTSFVPMVSTMYRPRMIAARKGWV